MNQNNPFKGKIIVINSIDSKKESKQNKIRKIYPIQSIDFSSIKYNFDDDLNAITSRSIFRTSMDSKYITSKIQTRV